MKYLLLCGSLRAESLNKKLLKVCASILSEKKSNVVEIVDLKTLSIPVYDGDVEALGIPQGVEKLAQLISQSHALILCSPEYNGSISGVLKNTIDWVSRVRPIPFERKPVFLAGASPGAFGAIRGLGATRPPLEILGAYVYPQPFALPKADQAFNKAAGLDDEKSRKKLIDSLKLFEEFAQKLL